MRVPLHYFLRNIHCVNIVVMVDQVLREGRKTYYKVKSAVPPPSQDLLYFPTLLHRNSDRIRAMGVCFPLVSKGRSGLHDLSLQGDRYEGLNSPHRKVQRDPLLTHANLWA